MNHSPDAGKMVCPHCGSESYMPGIEWRCGTEPLGENKTIQSTECHRICGLKARVKEFELATSDPGAVWVNMLRGTIAIPTHLKEADDRIQKLGNLNDIQRQELEAAQAHVKELEAYAARLEIAGDTLATVTLRNGRSHDQWHEAKETKP
jgi:hypothetical protein